MITSQRLSDGVLLFLPLCPSTNARMRPVRMGSRCRDILTAEARDYIQFVGLALRLWARAGKFKSITTWTPVWCWLILPRTTCDPHNYFKVSLDALQAGGVFSDDRYALVRIGGVHFNAKEPEMIFKL